MKVWFSWTSNRTSNRKGFGLGYCIRYCRNCRRVPPNNEDDQSSRSFGQAFVHCGLALLAKSTLEQGLGSLQTTETRADTWLGFDLYDTNYFYGTNAAPSVGGTVSGCKCVHVSLHLGEGALDLCWVRTTDRSIGISVKVVSVWGSTKGSSDYVAL